MTDPTVQLADTEVRVEPGGQTQTTVTIGNVSDIVEGFRLQVLGDEITGWTQVTPAEVQVYPGQQATAVLVFAPPEGSAAASGTFPFGLRVESVVDPSSSAVAEGDVEVGRVFGLTTRIAPVTSSGRWRGRHLVSVSNWGNAAVTLKVSSADPDGKLAFLVLPDHLELPVGATGVTRVQVRTRHPTLRGASVRLPFTVTTEPDPPDPRPPTPSAAARGDRQATLNATFEQKAILSRLVVSALALLLLVAAGGSTYALTRPKQTADLTAATGTPVAPAVTGTGVDQTTVQLTWTGQPAIDRYQLVAILAGKKGQVTEVDGAQEAVRLSGLQPGTEYCYQLAAIRGEQFGPPSDIVCASTAGAAVSSAPSSDPVTTPATTTAPVTGPDPTTPAPETPPSVPGGGPVVVPPSATTAGTPPSDPATTATGSLTQGGTTTSATAFGPGVYLALVYSTSTDSSGVAAAQAVRDQVRSALTGTDVVVEVLDSSAFPRLLVLGRPVVVDRAIVYVGSFGSAQEVVDFCAAHNTPKLATDCQVMQPAPAG